MNHFDKIALALPAAGLDGVLLTGEYNRFYASGFATTGTDGVALVTTEGNFYFTDSRYIEAAENTGKRVTLPGWGRHCLSPGPGASALRTRP